MGATSPHTRPKPRYNVMKTLGAPPISRRTLLVNSSTSFSHTMARLCCFPAERRVDITPQRLAIDAADELFEDCEESFLQLINGASFKSSCKIFDVHILYTVHQTALPLCVACSRNKRSFNKNVLYVSHMTITCVLVQIGPRERGSLNGFDFLQENGVFHYISNARACTSMYCTTLRPRELRFGDSGKEAKSVYI